MRTAVLAAIPLLMLPASLGAAGGEVDVQAVLAKLGVKLARADRPAWPKPPGSTVRVRLVGQVEPPALCVVSFGLPFGPGVLEDANRIRVVGADGSEIAAFTRPLTRWWIDGRRGSLRSVLVQFEGSVPPDGKEDQVTLAWDRPRAKLRPAETPAEQTRVVRTIEPSAAERAFAIPYEFHCPKVLAVLPAEWLCASLVAWQQVPTAGNGAAPWFDKHLAEQFDGSLRYIAAGPKAYEAHLFDRPATYAKIYVRTGAAAHLLASLQANDFYVEHLGPDGFLRVKPSKDVKYTYVEGSAILYMLTGDERYRSAIDRALRAWDTHRAIDYAGKGFWTERHHGFGMLGYLHAYEVTGEKAHLDKARRYFEAAWAMQTAPRDGGPPDGAWVHRASDHGDGNGWTASPWMSAFLADAIWKYWMLTGDRRAAASLAMYAKFIQTHAVTPDGKGVYYMANSPGRGRSENAESPPHNMEAIYLLAMGHYLAGGGDPGLLGRIAPLWPPLAKDSANRPGRKFTWRFRETSMLVWFLANAPR